MSESEKDIRAQREAERQAIGAKWRDPLPSDYRLPSREESRAAANRINPTKKVETPLEDEIPKWVPEWAVGVWNFFLGKK